MQTLHGGRFEFEVNLFLEVAMRFGALNDPPSRLYTLGEFSLLTEPNTKAIIGARKASLDARSEAYVDAYEHVAIDKSPVVSGGARGIDTAAMEGALQASRRFDIPCNMIVVLGGGIDKLYPAENAILFQEVVDRGGVIVSEQSWEKDPVPWMFTARNRLIASLADSLDVFEIGQPSGSMNCVQHYIDAWGSALRVYLPEEIAKMSHDECPIQFKGSWDLYQNGFAKAFDSLLKGDVRIKCLSPSLDKTRADEHVKGSQTHEVTRGTNTPLR